MKSYEDHVAKNGKPDSHAEAKELLAAFVGTFVDREVETRGVSSPLSHALKEILIRPYHPDGRIRP
jgi:hypothetical protein